MSGRVFVCLLLILSVVATATCFPPHSLAADKQCVLVKNYLDAVKDLCIYRFGEDREKAIVDAKSKFHTELQQLNLAVPPELDDLISRYVTSSTLGYDRMRKKGDTRLVKKAQDIQDQIKTLCPWD